MLLRKFRRLWRDRVACLTSREHAESGIAMIAAIGIMAVVIIVLVTLSASTINATGFATSTRAGVQARAAADAGVDAVRANLMAGSFACTRNSTGDEPRFEAKVFYDGATACQTPPSAPKSARILSTGWATSNSVGGSTSQNSQVVGATVTIDVISATPELSKAVFSDGDMTLTNQTSVYAVGAEPANLYSNGSISCLTRAEIQGGVVTQGNFSIGNDCSVKGAVWSGGAVALAASNASVLGDMYAVGDIAGGKANIGGSVVANGLVEFTGNSDVQCGASRANVCGSVYSLQKGVTLKDTATISGSAYARQAVAIGNGAVGKTVVSLADGAASLPLPPNASPGFAVPSLLTTPAGSTNMGSAGTQVRVNAPPREGMPQIHSTSADLTSKWAGWNRKVVTDGTMCNAGNDFESSLDTLTLGQTKSSKVLIVISGCSGPVFLDNRTIELKGDLAIMSTTGFATQNDLKIRSKVSGEPHQLSWIVPSDSPSVNWVAAGVANYPGQVSPRCNNPSLGNIAVDKAALSADIQWFVYTPCQVIFKNNTAFSGQIYAGVVGFPGGGKITRGATSVPGITVPGGSSGAGAGTTTVTLTSRYDVSG
jgi:hypothetical protein